MITRKAVSIVFILSLAVLSACQGLTLAEPTATPIPPTPTPLPPTELTICTGSEPESLYPYGLSSRISSSILQAIYEGPFDEVDGQYVPVMLISMPDYSNGGASFTAMTVKEGDQVIDIYGNLVALAAGDSIFPSGCTNVSCAITWDGAAPFQMDQPVVKYQLVPGLTWSDGQPLTAADSVSASR